MAIGWTVDWAAAVEMPAAPMSIRSRPRLILGPLPRVAMGVELDRAIRNGEAEGRADGAVDKIDVAAMCAHQLGRDRETEAGAAGAGRALERFEQMLAGLG